MEHSRCGNMHNDSPSPESKIRGSTMSSEIEIMRDSYRERCAAIKDLLREHNLDVFVLYGEGRSKTNPYHLWLSGVRCTTDDGLILMVTKDGTLKFIDVPWAADAIRSHLNHFAIAADVLTAPSEEALYQVFRNMSASYEKIGYAGTLPVSMCSGSVDRYRCLHEIDLLMRHKNPIEIRWMVESARAINEIAQDVAESIAPGMLESQIATLIDDNIRKVGGIPAFTPARIVSGPSLSVTTGRAKAGKQVAVGDALCIDIGHITQAGIYSDITRMIFLGENPANEEYLRLSAALEAVVRQLSCGMCVRDVLQLTIEEVRLARLPQETLVASELGHGIGYKLHEHPYIALPEHLDTELVEGSVICLEPEIYTKNSAIRIEHEVLIMKNSAEIISR